MSDTDDAQEEPNGTTKGRVRRISEKKQDAETTHNTATDNVTNRVDDTDTNESESAVDTMHDETLQAHVEQVATGILDGVLGQSGIVNAAKNNPPAQQPLSRGELAAARARQMRLNMAREFMKTGKLLSAKQRLVDILDSAPHSAEADVAIELLLELAAHYESLGQSRWALDLYDDIARYD